MRGRVTVEREIVEDHRGTVSDVAIRHESTDSVHHEVHHGLIQGTRMSVVDGREAGSGQVRLKCGIRAGAMQQRGDEEAGRRGGDERRQRGASVHAQRCPGSGGLLRQ